MMLYSFSHTLAQAAAPAGGPPPAGLLGNSMWIPILMFVMMYFVLIRPQRLRQKELEKLVSSVKVGDHVIMNGGEHGIITSVKEKTVMLKVADNTKVEYERSAISSVSKKSDVVEAANA